MKHKYKLKEEPLNVGSTKTQKGVKSTLVDKDPITGTISWDIEYTPSYGKTFRDFDALKKSFIELSNQSKDQNITNISDSIRGLFNQYRLHIRKNYPEEYNKIGMKEISTSGGAGAYLTPYAFKLKKKQKKIKEGPGATLGPGPSAGPNGVTNSAYTKQFKYKLVPKNKNNTYVQKGSGMIVKKLF